MDSSADKIFRYLERASQNHWIGCSWLEIVENLQQSIQIIRNVKKIAGYAPRILLCEPEPVLFLGHFLGAVVESCPVFLGNLNWTETEWKQVFQQVQPDLILGSHFKPNSFQDLTSAPTTSASTIPPLPDLPHLILIPTGGSSGNVRFAIHTWNTLAASVQGFQHYFERQPIHAFCSLPLYHVSGLMQFLRCLITGGNLVISPFKAIEIGQIPDLDFSDFFISLVPTQLQRLLNHPQQTQWLAQFHTVLLGGAPAWSELLDQAREQHIQLAPTYGMTETAAQVVTLKPQDFLAGNNSVGQALPHAKVTVYQDLGEVCAINQPGLITIQTNSLMWGYYGESSLLNSTALNPDRCFQTDDLGYFDQQGYLTIIGRNSQKIITGGENVFPGEIELAIQATNLVEDVCVVGLPDRHWGQVVAAVYVPKPFTSAALLNAKLQGQLSSYKLPKHWIEIPQIPRNPQGKINRPQLEEIAKSSL